MMTDVDKLHMEGPPCLIVSDADAEKYNAVAERLQRMAQDAYPNLIWRCQGIEAGALDPIMSYVVAFDLVRIEARITVTGWSPLCCMTHVSLEQAKEPSLARMKYDAIAKRLVNALSNVLLDTEGIGKGYGGDTVVRMEETP